MDHISIAIEKARRLRQEKIPSTAPAAAHPPQGPSFFEKSTTAPELTFLKLDEAHLEAGRVIARFRHHPAHIAFDMLRTKVAHSMASHNWTSIAVTSPTPNCGKSFVALNLAFSMAHQPDRTVVLVDLDLRAPRIASLLGQRPAKNFTDYLNDKVDLSAICARVSENLIVCLNGETVERAAEWIGSDKITKISETLRSRFGANVIIFDLPPALNSDDVMAFGPSVDCAVLVAAAGTTTAREIEEAERHLALTNYLGVVLNKVVGAESKLYSDYSYSGRPSREA